MGLKPKLFILRSFNVIDFLVAVDYIYLLHFKVNFILKFAFLQTSTQTINVQLG